MNQDDLKDLGLTHEELAAVSGDDEPSDDVRVDSREETETPAPPAPHPATPPAGGYGFIPEYQGPALQDIQAKLDDLDTQLEEGDIDIVQYTKQRDPLIEKRIEAGLSMRAREAQWKSEQDAFFTANPAYKLRPALNGALGKVFRALDTPENANRTGLELLNEAKRQVELEARQLREGVPARSGGGSGGQNDFAHLDSLEGADFERALSRLSPDEAERYLRGQ